MAFFPALARRLYLRIWLAVIVAVAVVILAAGWAWRETVRFNRLQAPPPREVTVRNPAGELIGSALAQPARTPGGGIEFRVQLSDGQTLWLQMPPRGSGGARPPAPLAPPWYRPPYGYFWLLGLVAVAVAAGLYPVARRLTHRLETLQQGVQRWGNGDLAERVPEGGQDEVADLARHFNAAAEKVEALMQTQKALLGAQKTLLANASHELRSPLARIRMALELQRQNPTPAIHDEISRNIGELDQLIDEILMASRLDSPDPGLGPVESVDLVGLAAEEAARVDAQLELPQGHTIVLRGETRLLRRLLRNLLENARRHGDADRSEDIRVELGTDPGGVTIRVGDRGPGVPPDQRERIFEPFYRLPGSSEREGGVGLGLALVKSIAQRHDGSVSCLDRVGGGAEFVVRLPHDRS